MNKHTKTLISILAVTVFVITNVICCCVIKSHLQAFKKIACSHCPSKDSSSPVSKQCCFSKASPMELAKNQIFHITTPVFLALVMFVFIQLVPKNRLVLRSLYINGPPGPYALVPLYIKARSIRI